MLKRLLSLTLLLTGFCLSVEAGPAKGVRKTVTQPDGARLSLTLTGDERLHYYLTSDGYPVLEKDGAYYYATPTADNVALTQTLAHEAADRTAGEKQLLESKETVALKLKAARKAAFQSFPMRVGTPTPNLTGTKRGLVILMAFKDQAFVTANPKQAIERMCNETGYNLNGALGSVNDYFKDQSNGVFDLQFDVVGPYTASQEMSYYGNNGASGKDVNVQLFVREAITLVDDDVDFTKYDWDNDGYVDQVYIVYAGYAESAGAPSGTIWPHESVLQPARKKDGVRIKTYACGSELTGTSGTVLDGISTMCHEFSHCLGLPDLYDTNTSASSNYGMNQWSLMASGTQNASGNIPPSFTGYEKAFCGWAEPKVLSEACKVTGLKPIADGGDCYKIVNPGNSNEYYLLENRNGSTGWDQGLAADSEGDAVGGLLIYHVTYDATAWSDNVVNASSRTIQRLVPIPADGDLYNYFSTDGGYHTLPDGLAGDLYGYVLPSGAVNRILSDDTTPAAALNTANSDGTNLMHCKVNDIQVASDGSLSFVFNDGTTEYSDLTGIETVAVGSATGDGVFYNLQGVSFGKDATLLPKGIYIYNNKKVVVK